ncbi:hypothetical protein CFter6_4239 [Collimonas fungivorans]|uniref:Uncharacterized protein n=1 Tax=Collimonas fungivorans TaxID=158899 RepID=A0A127PGA1_9BURK|nr:hypothetical protein CFter6_4239 [Collimonas fungivorans]
MFDTKARAQEWASKVESDMRALKFQDERIISDLTLGTLIDRYTEEIGAKKSFGKNKTAVLASLKIALGDILLPNLTSDRLVDYIEMRSTGYRKSLPTRSTSSQAARGRTATASPSTENSVMNF